MAPKKGAISFGLVYIPVDVYNATSNSDISFNQLVKDSKGNLSRVKYKKTCPSCKAEVKNEDIVKGFQYEKDKYVVVTDEDFEKIKTKKDRSINILQFSDPDDVPSIYVNKSYHLMSQQGGEKAFEVLRRAMIEKHKVAIGQTVLGNNESLILLKPDDGGILMQTLYYEEEVKDIPKATNSPEVGGEELEVASKLIDSMTADFDPSQFQDDYQTKLKDLIENKIEGKETVAEDDDTNDNVIDLMDALQKSLKGNNKNSTKKKTSRKNSKSKTG